MASISMLQDEDTGEGVFDCPSNGILDFIGGTGTDRSCSRNGCVRHCGPFLFPFVSGDVSDLPWVTGLTLGGELRDDEIPERVFMKKSSDSMADVEVGELKTWPFLRIALVRGDALGLI